MHQLGPADSRPPVTPQLALRVTVLGAIALVVFAVVFFRLWYVQVLSGDRYLAEANDNRVREIKVQAPRGQILDRNGRVLVENRTGLAVQLQPDRAPSDPAARRALYERLGKLIGLSAKRIDREVREQRAELPFSAVTLRQDVDREKVYYLLENPGRFPGVDVQRVFLRRYPHGTLAAHVLGHVGEISPEELDEDEHRDREQGDIIGQDGIEQTYDRFLRGRNGASRIQVDAQGRSKGELRSRDAVSGKNLRLSLDLKLQRAGERALASQGKPGGFAAIDPRNGQVLALGSAPTFDPKLFTKRLSQRRVERLYRADPAPYTNRATQAAYPTGSTFKLISSVAGLEEGLVTPGTVINDAGTFQFGGRAWKNAGSQPYGAVNLRRALKVSSDIYYYKLGIQANGHGNGLAIQRWAKRLGLGTRTGIDLPNEAKGLIPTREWRNRLYRKKLTDRPWSVGDNMNFAVGQGDLSAAPLQMAVAYATIYADGTVYSPRLGLRVEEPGGRPLQEVRRRVRRRVSLGSRTRQAVKDGIKAAATEPGGTSHPIFGGWPIAVAGKTGTAETPQGDQSWYVAAAPANDPQIVVAFTVERGGFGAEAAAPAVERMLAAFLDVKPKQIDPVAGGVAPD